MEEFLATRVLKEGETPGQAVLSAMEFHIDISPLAVCFALVTVAADLRLYGSKELGDVSDNCFVTAALLACDVYAAAPKKDCRAARAALLNHWGDGNVVFNRAMRTR